MSASRADAAAGRRYQEYAEHILALESVRKTSPDVEEPIDVSAQTNGKATVRVRTAVPADHTK